MCLRSFRLLVLVTADAREGEGEHLLLEVELAWLSREFFRDLSLPRVLAEWGTGDRGHVSIHTNYISVQMFYTPLRNCCCCRNCIFWCSSESLPERTASVWREISVSSLARVENSTVQYSTVLYSTWPGWRTPR